MLMQDKLTYSVSETAQVLGISRPTCYALLNRPDFPSFKVGTRTLIPVEGLRDWVENQSKPIRESDAD